LLIFSPSPKQSDLLELGKKLNNLENKTNALNSEINKNNPRIRIPENGFVSSGTAFLLDTKGYLITSAHVLQGNKAIVFDNKGQEYNARIITIDQQKDLALLKIEDSEYKPANLIPYSFKKNDVALGEELYTLGYPRDVIVYDMGYMSAESGFNNDSTSCQLSINANPGNSGGPVFNKYGEVVGVISTRQIQAEGVVFAVKISRYL